MNEIMNSSTLMIGLISALITISISFVIFFIYQRIKKSQYDFDLQRIQMEQFRSSLEKELYKINERLSADSDRWKDINHLLISGYSNEKPIRLNKRVILNDFLKSNGISPKDLVIDKDLIFVLTPFHEKFQKEYDTIKKICTNVGFKCRRGDEQYFSSDIFPEMLRLMVKSNLVIANINGKNPNVLYELGICQALDKPVILIAKNAQNLPIDIKSKRFLVYNSTQELNTLLKDELIKLLKTQTIKEEIKINTNSINIEEWQATTNRKNFQGTDYKKIDLNDLLLTSISCKVFPESEYFRFGFKLLDKKAAIFRDGGILSPDNSRLLHICKNLNSNVIGATFYKGTTLDKDIAVVPDYNLGEPILVRLIIDNNNNLQFFVNDNLTYLTEVTYDVREQLILMAWGDDNDFAVTITDIEIEVR